MDKNLSSDDFPLTNEEWNDLGVRALSLKFMDAIRRSSEPPLDVDALVKVSGLSKLRVKRLCTGDAVLDFKTLQVFQKAMKAHVELQVKVE